MLLKDIMTKDVLTLSPNDSLEKAAELLWSTASAARQ